jgi:ABC-type antimicrobial peptide transport system permease subunit
MRPFAILRVLEIEAVWLTMLGVALGVAAGAVLVVVLGVVGIPLGDAGALLQRFHMPDRIYPALSRDAVLLGPLIMFAAIPLAALLPALRILRLRPVLAMREDA